jgi:TetR/AcrR family transcriptional regulator, transcriptional repressor for nem operon
MWEHGVNGTTLDDVREASATSKSQLYRHFTTKKELVLGVVREHSGIVIARESAALADVSTFADLRAWADHLVQVKARRRGAYGCVLGTFANELSDQDEEARIEIAATLAAWRGFIADALRRIAGTDGTGGIDADRLAIGVLGALQGGYVMARAARDTDLMQASIDLALDHLEGLL